MVTLDEAKNHIRVDQDEDDAAILAMIDAAETAALDYLNLDELPDAAPVQAAVLMLVGSLYMNRESQTDRPIVENRLFTRLLDPYRQMVA